MQRETIGQTGARYAVRRPPWRAIGRAVGGRLVLAVALSAWGALILEYAPAVLR